MELRILACDGSIVVGTFGNNPGEDYGVENSVILDCGVHDIFVEEGDSGIMKVNPLIIQRYLDVPEEERSKMEISIPVIHVKICIDMEIEDSEEEADKKISG